MAGGAAASCAAADWPSLPPPGRWWKLWQPRGRAASSWTGRHHSWGQQVGSRQRPQGLPVLLRMISDGRTVGAAALLQEQNYWCCQKRQISCFFYRAFTGDYDFSSFYVRNCGQLFAPKSSNIVHLCSVHRVRPFLYDVWAEIIDAAKSAKYCFFYRVFISGVMTFLFYLFKFVVRPFLHGSRTSEAKVSKSY